MFQIKIVDKIYHWKYHVESDNTSVYTPNSTGIIHLPYKATKKEVKAAIYGYLFGVNNGINQGKIDKTNEIKKVLNIN